jgi:hypothetical protein
LAGSGAAFENTTFTNLELSFFQQAQFQHGISSFGRVSSFGQFFLLIFDQLWQ